MAEKELSYEDAVARGPQQGEVSYEDAVKGGATEPPAAKPMSTLDRFATGFRDPITGVEQIAEHIRGKGKEADEYVRDREKRIAASTPNIAQSKTVLDDLGRSSHTREEPPGDSSPDPVRGLGEMANPLTWAGSWLRPGLRTAVELGVRQGVLSPTTDEDFASGKTKQVVGGAVTGAATQGAGRVLGGAIRPEVRPGVRALMDEGVQLTPGQMAGGNMRDNMMGNIVKRAEEAAKSIPIVGSFIRASERRTLDTFNRATANQALAPIGVRVPETSTGHMIIGDGQLALSDAYDAVLQRIHFDMNRDPQFGPDVQSLFNLTRGLPEAQRGQFDFILRQRLAGRLSPTGTMSGDTLKGVESELGNFASNYRHSSDAAQRQLGEAVSELQAIVRDSLARQHPNEAQRLQDINTAYAMFARIEGAAARRASSTGVFTPGDLLGAIKAQDRTVRKRGFARGDALLQNWAETGNEVIGNKLPDSGSPERLLWDVGKGALVGGGAHVAGAGLPVLGAMGVGSTIYSEPAQRALNAVVRNRAPWRDTAKAAINRNAAYAAPPAAAGTLAELGVGQNDEQSLSETARSLLSSMGLQ